MTESLLPTAPSASAEPDRVLALEGIHNFRDYGGYRTASGRLRRGMLWRSGQHGEASDADLAQIAALGLATVADLRGDSERASSPCRRPPDFAAEVLFEPGETASEAGRAVHEENAGQVRSAADAHGAMIRVYETLPWRPVLVGTFRLWLDALVRGHGPNLVHCLAGKDRTGLGVALVHHLTGVHADDAMADYLLTNTAGDVEKRIAAGARHLRGGFGSAMDDAAIRMVMSVQPEFLATSLDAITARHGSITAYAATVLGITPEKRAALVEHLTE